MGDRGALVVVGGFVLGAVLLAVAVTSSGGPPPTTSASASASGLRWSGCDDPALAEGECATLPVPLDHDDPHGATIDLALYRLAAPGELVATLLVNPGGPGASGVDYVAQRGRAGFPAELEVIGFDPRGVGRSHPVSCLTADNVAGSLDEPTATDDPGVLARWLAQAAHVAQRCQAADLGRSMGTVDVARDMDLIRAAAGVDAIDYVGFSYGTRLGWTYAALFPDHVRAMVLDAPEDPAAGERELLLRQAATFEDLLVTFGDACATHPDWGCPARPAAAIETVLATANQAPIPAAGETADLSGTYALNAVLSAFYDEASWPDLGRALTDALGGDGGPLLALSYFWQQRSGDELIDASAAQELIYCSDHDERLSTDDLAAIAGEVAEVSPTFAGAFPGSVPRCYGYESADDDTPEVGEVGDAAGTAVLVVGATDDIATPYAGAERLTDALPGAVLLTRQGTGHTSYGLNPCIDHVVDRYLVTGALPVPGTVCR